MTTLLHIECSPRKQRSASLEVARSFIDRYQQNHPQTRVETLDLWDMSLADLDEEAMNAKYAVLAGTPLTATQQTAWDQLKALAAPLYRADVLVLSVPLWNFSVPYKLKHFIDLVSHQNILFSFDPQTACKVCWSVKQPWSPTPAGWIIPRSRARPPNASTFKNRLWKPG